MMAEASTTATDRNVFILGAGFSRPAGAPLIHDFLERSRQFMNSRPDALDNHSFEHFMNVFRFKAEMAKAREKINIDLDNVEELFGLVEMSCRLGGASRKTRDSMVYLIVKTLELCTMPRSARARIGYVVKDDLKLPAAHLGIPQHETGRYMMDMYDFFAALISGQFDVPSSTRSTSVITFNYDLILDDALRRVDVSPDYGFHAPSNALASIKLYKLHGSANWGICRQCGNRAIFAEKVTRVGQEVRCVECKTEAYVPLLVPPSWDKTEYRDVVAPIWEAAVDEIKRATRICIIGYSMPESDAFFRYLITLGLAENHQLERLIVVDYHVNSPGVISTAPVVHKWTTLLDSTFRQRRFSCYFEGLESFVGHSQICSELNRGAAVQYVGLFGPDEAHWRTSGLIWRMSANPTRLTSLLSPANICTMFYVMPAKLASRRHKAIGVHLLAPALFAFVQRWGHPVPTVLVTSASSGLVLMTTRQHVTSVSLGCRFLAFAGPPGRRWTVARPQPSPPPPCCPGQIRLFCFRQLPRDIFGEFSAMPVMRTSEEQLRDEELLLCQLLQTKLSALTRSKLEELLTLVRSERQHDMASSQAAD